MKRKFLICSVVFTLFLQLFSANGEEGRGNKRAGGREGGVRQHRQIPNGERKLYANKIISQLSDSEKKRLRELQKSDVKAFRREIRKIAGRYKTEHSKKSKEIRNLITAFHSAEGDEKSVLKEKIREFVRAQFNRKMEGNKKNYEKAEKRLKELKKRLEVRENNAEIIIQERVRELTKDPALHW